MRHVNPSVFLVRSHSDTAYDNKSNSAKVAPPRFAQQSFEATLASEALQDALEAKALESDSNPIVGVIGVGYVGVQLVEAFAHHFRVIAFDVNDARLSEVAGELGHLPIRFTSTASDLSDATFFLVSVPTNLKQDKTIDTKHLQSAVTTVGKYARPGSTVVMESSVAVGMTRQLLGPLAAAKNVKVGMSPERVDPGRSFPLFEDIPKIISSIDETSMQSIHKIYEQVFRNVVPVTSLETAEMAKLYENCQRMVCAAYANEMADACTVLGIDAWEVSQAAASKPFGYQPFRPGPGIGGHCIPVNPYYLLSTCSMPLLQNATENSWRRPSVLAQQLMGQVKGDKSSRKDSMQPERPSILVVGVGFKRGQSVLSNSPGLAIGVALLSEFDVYVEFADPLVSSEAVPSIPKMDVENDWNEEYLSKFNGIIVAVDQPGLDMSILEYLPNTVVHNYCPQEQPLSLTTQAVTSGGAVIRKMSTAGIVA